MVRPLFLTFLIAGLAVMAPLQAQVLSERHFENGLAYEKDFQVEKALNEYQQVLRYRPDHVEALVHGSRMLSNIAGKMPKTQLDRKRELLTQSRTYSEKAIQLNPNHPEARLAHIISLGLLSEIATSPRQKVIDAGLIHGEAKKILQIDSTFAEAYFVLGKWQYELNRLNWLELMACKLIFGGFPEKISIDASVRYFNKAIEFNPNSILFLFGQGSAQHELGETEKAVATLNRALSLPIAEPDDTQRKERCATLLKQIIQ